MISSNSKNVIHSVNRILLQHRRKCQATYNIRNVHSATTARSVSNSTESSTTRAIPITTSDLDPASSSHSDASTKTTYAADEVDKFRRMADEWWKHNGDFKALHSMNELRVALVRDGLIESGLTDISRRCGPEPLQGVKILDVGCGGGIFSEPLARLGAQVTGLDAASEGVEVARLHSEKDSNICGKINYICGKIEDHVKETGEYYDAVVASEVVEHIASLETFLDSCSSCLTPGGSLFVTTINRTPQSFVAAIVVAEYLMRLLPAGTHDWNKFVKPEDLKQMLTQRGFATRLTHGMCYLPLSNTWRWGRNASVSYALHAVKPSSAPPLLL